MLSNRTNKDGAQTIEDVRHPFVRLPQSNASNIFQGWGPKL